MDSQSKRIIISTFINPHLFWFVEKRHLQIRNAFNRRLNKENPKLYLENVQINKLYASIVDGVWVRIKVISELTNNNNIKSYRSWLIDYGIMRITNNLYNLPDDMKQCAPLAKSASLHNVINLIPIPVNNTMGSFDISYEKTLNIFPGVTVIAIDIIESAEELYFQNIKNDYSYCYGDIIYVIDKEKKSLSKTLIEKQLMIYDEEMFKRICYRDEIKENYFKISSNLYNKLNNPEKYVFDEENEFI